MPWPYYEVEIYLAPQFLFTDLYGYVRSLLGVEEAIFNVMPLAQSLNLPEELINQIKGSWKDEDEQLRILLAHFVKGSDMEKDLAAVRKGLEGLEQQG